MNHPSRFTIRKLQTKLLLAFGGMALLIAAVSLLSISLVTEIDEEMDYVIDVSGPMVEASDDIIKNLWESLKVTLEHAGSVDAENMREYRAEFDKLYGRVQDAGARLDGLVPDEEIQQELDGALENLAAYETHVYELMDAHEAGDEAATTALKRTARRDVDAAIGHLDEVVVRADELGKQADERSDEAAAFAMTALWTALVLGFVLALGIGYFVSRMITRPVGKLAAAADRAAEGDLDVSVEVKTQDEVGRLATAFNGMITQVRRSVEEVREKSRAAEAAQTEAEAAQAEAQAQQAYLGRSVDALLTEMNAFADGDLTVRAEAERADDEIAELFAGFNRAAENLRQMIERVGAAVEATASASSEISASTDQLSAAAQEQSAQSQEVSAAVEQMTRTVIENSQSATRTAEVAKQNGEAAGEGGEVVAQTVAKIRRIAEVVAESAGTVEALGASSKQIGEIVATIDDIADQTNLLALNAAIEAARAGEHGRGFAVVADEVRKLAERTTVATKEIADMIRTVQAGTEAAVTSMREGNEEVEEGITLADRAGDALRRIVAGTDQTVDMVAQIAAASEEQSTTSEQMARSVEMISTVSGESAAGLSQIADATGGLGRLTEELRELVGRFRTDATAAANASASGSTNASASAARSASGDGFAARPSLAVSNR
jgi:methyl-accepting chemotaxis protein